MRRRSRSWRPPRANSGGRTSGAEFASIVSYDLRNPLNVTRSRLELAREQRDSDHLAAVARTHDGMETLIEDLLALAREDERVTDPDPVDLAAVADRCWRNLATAGRHSPSRPGDDPGRRATAPPAPREPSSQPRGARLRGQSAGTTSPGGARPAIGPLRYRCRTRRRGRDRYLDWGFHVADGGPGIPPDERDDVFESGYSTTGEGTGLGLSIVERVADAHGWRVGVTESEAGGARVGITGVERPA